MGLAQVEYMHVIPNASAVRCVIVLPEELNAFSGTSGRIQHQGNEMGFRMVALSQSPRRIRPRRIEIAQRNEAQSLGAIEILQ